MLRRSDTRFKGCLAALFNRNANTYVSGRACVVPLAFIVSLSAVAQTAGYSAAPLQKSALEPAQVVIEAVDVNNWLQSNASQLAPQQLPAVREHVHALIDSRVKEIYLRDKSILPKKWDPILASLYSWGGRLGVFGADQVYARVRGSYPVQPPPGPRAPIGMAISLDGDALKVSSGMGKWEVSVPYHFFVFELENGPDRNGNRREAVAIAMGSATDVAAPGYSNATLGVIFSPGTDMQAFARTWTERIGLPASVKEEPVGPTKYRSRRYYDEATRLHKEVVFVPSATGPLAIVYSGRDGTYQWNRPHFFDFLGKLKVAR